MTHIAPRITPLLRRAFICVALSAGALTAHAAQPALTTVNGVAIDPAMVEFYRIQGRANGMSPAPEQDEDIQRHLVEQELLFQAASQAGYDKRPEVSGEVAHAQALLRAQMRATAQAIVTRAYVADYLAQHPITDAQLRKQYDAARVLGGKTEYKARHILVKTEPEARAIIAKLKAGASFDSVAGNSVDAVSERSGGRLDWSSPARFTPAFANALRQLGKGAYSKEPVKTEFGYHVIQVDDTRPLTPPSFDQLKGMLRQEAQRQQISDMVAALRAKAKIQ
jgi:peptidyl-prolyl cis-trans isomerase C